MKPYYMDSLVTLYHGDASELMPHIREGVVVSDPPYNIGYHYDSYADRMTEDKYFSAMATMLAGPSVVIHYPESIIKLAMKMGVAPERIAAWVYPSNTARQHRSVAWFGCKPDFRKDGQNYRNPNDKRIAERIAKGKRARLYDWWEINQVKNVSSEKTGHPCQIPETLMRRIMRITPTDYITDPFAGSGTTLLAAKLEGIHSIGIEMSERYCEIIAKRIQNSSTLV